MGNLIKHFYYAEDAVKKKWKSLRDVFRAELKRLPKPKSGDETPSTFTSSWTFFNNMVFLKDQMNPRRLTGSVTVSETEIGYDTDMESQAHTLSQTETEDFYNEEETEQDTFEQHADDVSEKTWSTIDQQVVIEENTLPPNIPGPSGRTNFKAPVTKRVVKRKHDSDMDTFLHLEKEKLQLLKANDRTNNDDDYHFLMSFLPSMKRMTYSTKMLFRLKMQELVYKCTVSDMMPQAAIQSRSTPSPLISPTPSTTTSEHSFSDYQHMSAEANWNPIVTYTKLTDISEPANINNMLP